MKPIFPILLSALLTCPAMGSGAVQIAPPRPAESAPDRAPEGALPLPADSTIVTGRLSNGLRFVIAPRPNPAGDEASVALVLQVSAGSAYEGVDQIGAARLAADLVASGAFARDKHGFEKSIRALGVDEQRGIRSSASYNSTRFTLSVPIEGDQRLSSADISRAVEVMSSLLATDGGSLDEKVLASARHDLLAAQMSWSGPSQRITARALPQLFGDSVFARHVPIYSEALLEMTDASSVESFVSSWYAPRNATLVVVGSVDAPVVQRAIEKMFGPIAAGDATDGPDLSIPKPRRGSVLIESDPGVAGDVVQLTLIETAAKPVVCTSTLRERLAERVATEALNRRLAELARSSDAATLQGAVFTNPDAGGYRMSMLSVAGASGEWERLTREAVASLHSAQEFGFTEREVAAAKERVREAIESEASSYSTRSNNSLAGEFSSKMRRGDVLTDSRQYRQLAITSLSVVDAADVSVIMKRLFEIDVLSAIVVTGADQPAADEVRRQIQTARSLDARAVAEVTPMPADAPMFGEIRKGGSATDLRFDANTEVTRATLPSGVRLYHRPMETGGGRIEIAAALALNEITTDPAARAELSSLAALQWQPATMAHASSRMAQSLRGRDISFGVEVKPESVVFTISTTPDEFDFAMQMLDALLRSARIEHAALERWRVLELQGDAASRSEPNRAALRLFEHRVVQSYGERVGHIDEAAIHLVTTERAQTRLDSLLKDSPLSVAIIGDIDRSRALQVGAVLLTDLPTRRSVATMTVRQRGSVEPQGPVEIRLEQDLGPDTSAVAIGFLGADAAAVEDAVALDIASDILENRLRDRFREGGLSGVSVGVWSVEAEVVGGSGRFWARAMVAPDQAERVAGIISEELDKLVQGGPSERELGRAVESVERSATRRSNSLSAWAVALVRDEGLAGEPMRVLQGRPEATQRVTADRLREVLERYRSPERSFRILVLPRAGR